MKIKGYFYNILPWIIKSIILIIIIMLIWPLKDEKWFFPLLLIYVLFYLSQNDFSSRLIKLEHDNEGISEGIYERIRKNKYEDIEVDCDDLGFKLQRIVSFNFQPQKGLCKKLSSIVNEKQETIGKQLMAQGHGVTIQIIDYTDDLRMFKTTYIKKGSGVKDEVVNYEYIDYPNHKDYPWEADIAFHDVADDILFNYDLNENKTGFTNRLYIGHKGSDDKEVITLFIQAYDKNDDCKNTILKEIPVYSKENDKHSILEDKYGMKKMYKMYEQDDKELGAFWKLYIVEHKSMVEYRKKYMEFEAKQV
ncbi:hypothetical protein ACFL52_02665 [Candidatus Margulisiibacteriota bacterium]